MESNNIPNSPSPVNNPPTIPKPVNQVPINNAPVNPVPVIPESEMKLPVENFGDAATAPEKKSSVWTVLLLILLVLLLGILTVVVIWGKEIVDMVLPVATVEDTMTSDLTPTLKVEPTPEEDIAAVESELEGIDLEAMDAELNAIEAELDAEVSASTTATP